jgi:hypothetical protein
VGVDRDSGRAGGLALTGGAASELALAAAEGAAALSAPACGSSREIGAAAHAELGTNRSERFSGSMSPSAESAPGLVTCRLVLACRCRQQAAMA